MAQKPITKCCFSLILFVIIVTHFVIPEIECKRLHRAEERMKHTGKKSSSLQTINKHSKPKIVYDDKTMDLSETSKSAQSLDKYIAEYIYRKGEHVDKSAEQDNSYYSYQTESLESKTKNVKPRKKDSSDASIFGGSLSSGQHSARPGSNSKESLETWGLEKSLERLRSGDIEERARSSTESNVEEKEKYSNRKKHSKEYSHQLSHTKEINTASSESKSPYLKSGISYQSKAIESKWSGYQESKSDSQSSRISSRHDKSKSSNHIKHGKSKTNTKAETVTSEIDAEEELQDTGNLNYEYTVTDYNEQAENDDSEEQVADEDVGNIATTETPTLFSSRSNLKATTFQTSVSNTYIAPKISTYTTESNLESEYATTTQIPSTSVLSTVSTKATAGTNAFTTELEQDNEKRTSQHLEEEAGTIIKPPFYGWRKPKERTPTCCIEGQLEINLGTINRKARTLGSLDGVVAKVSDKPNKRYIRCSNSAEIKVNFEPMGSDGCFGCTSGPFCGRRLLQLDLDLSRNRRRNTLLFISESLHKSDGAVVHAEFPHVTVYPRYSVGNKTRQILIRRAFNSNTDKMTIFIGNQFLRFLSNNRLDENFCENDLFHLNGQFDMENGGMSPNVITIGVNTAFTGTVNEANYGICSAKLKWACPWQDVEAYIRK